MSISFRIFGGRRGCAPARASSRRPLRLEALEDRCLLDAVPFTIGGDPRVHPQDFRITTFASGLNFPTSMRQLDDGSLLVGTSRPVGANFYNSTGELIRLVDANQDGVADGPGTVLYSGLPGAVTSVRRVDDLFFVTSSQPGSERISVLRPGRTPADALTLVGSINFAFPSGWEHTTYNSAVRGTPNQPGSFDVFFNVGSQQNFAKTTATVAVSGLVTGTVQGDSIYRVSFKVVNGAPVFSNLQQIATGLRNAAGMTFDPVSGDLYFEDNGIDGGGNPEEELSADELNRIRGNALGATVQDFGFPRTYVDYFTGRTVGQGGVPPLVAFVPGSGPEIAGPSEIAFAPAQFPAGLNNGVFVGFHGLFDVGGAANDENPVAYVDLKTRTYFRFIANSVPGVGHLDGLLATKNSLFLADISSNGDLFNSTQTGVIYQIQVLPSLGAHALPAGQGGRTPTHTAEGAEPDRAADALPVRAAAGATAGNDTQLTARVVMDRVAALWSTATVTTPVSPARSAGMTGTVAPAVAGSDDSPPPQADGAAAPRRDDKPDGAIDGGVVTSHKGKGPPAFESPTADRGGLHATPASAGDDGGGDRPWRWPGFAGG